MGKIYESQEDYDKAFEEEFKRKVEEVEYYYGSRERTTIDGEWTFDELKDDLWGEAKKILEGDKGWIETHKFRAFKDPDLIKLEYLVEDICNRYDLIEVYNKAYDKHRNDKPMKFGIHYFDELAVAEVLKTLNNNLLT